VNVVVTGGAGFIGANLCRELAGRDGVDEVVVVDNLSTGTATNLDGCPVKLVEGSILDRDLVDEVIGAADAVVHLAALPSVPRSLADPMASHHANATGTLHVLEAARRGRTHVVGASSSSVYGSVDVLPKHEDLATRPLSPYAASKLATEGYLLAYGSAFAVPTLALRLFNVYGPLQSSGHAYAAVIPSFVTAALRGEPLRIQGDGTQTRDFTYVGTVCRIVVDAVVRRVVATTPVNLAFGTRTSVGDLAQRIARRVDRPVEIRHEPARPGDVPASQADNNRLRALFPWAQPTGLDTGLDRTVAWFKERLEAPALVQRGG
jgi:UDP-glucose 4-epimerase